MCVYIYIYTHTYIYIYIYMEGPLSGDYANSNANTTSAELDNKLS